MIFWYAVKYYFNLGVAFSTIRLTAFLLTSELLLNLTVNQFFKSKY